MIDYEMRKYTVQIGSDENFSDLKEILRSKYGINPTSLYWKSQLLDDKMISEVDLGPRDVITIHKSEQLLIRSIPPFFVYTKEKGEPVKYKEKASAENKKEVSIGKDPPEFQTMVAGLLELGYNREHCMTALRKNGYDLNLAAEWMMVNPQLAPPPQKQQPPPQKQQPPANSDKPKHVIPELTAYFKKLQPLQQAVVRKLQKLGLPFAKAVQLFIDTEGNEEEALARLKRA